nr:hypothetical protein Iba_chr07fCG3940 [Ipomoea batatas]
MEYHTQYLSIFYTGFAIWPPFIHIQEKKSVEPPLPFGLQILPQERDPFSTLCYKPSTITRPPPPATPMFAGGRRRRIGGVRPENATKCRQTARQYIYSNNFPSRWIGKPAGFSGDPTVEMKKEMGTGVGMTS